MVRQVADIFMKGLPTALFDDFRDSLYVGSPDLSLRGGSRRSPTAMHGFLRERTSARRRRARRTTPTRSPG